MDLTKDLNLLKEAIRALRELSYKDDEEKPKFKKLFDGEKIGPRSRMKLMMSLFKIPEVQDNGLAKSINIRVPIPHNFVDEEADVLLITRDAPGHKALRSDEQPSIHKYQDLLREHNALDLVTRVMPLKQLKTEYKEYEAKSSLCGQFDIILCDEAIFRRVPLFLGGVFYKRGKLPIPVDLGKKDLLKEITKVLSTIHLHMDLKGDAAAAQFGRFGQTDEELAENLQAFVKVISDRIPGKWENLRSLHIRTRSSKAMPIYISLKSPNDVESVDHPNAKKAVGPVSGFLDSFEKEVFVYPDYSVSFKKPEISGEVEEFVRTITENEVSVKSKSSGNKQSPYVGNIVRRKALKKEARGKKPDKVTFVKSTITKKNLISKKNKVKGLPAKKSVINAKNVGRAKKGIVKPKNIKSSVISKKKIKKVVKS